MEKDIEQEKEKDKVLNTEREKPESRKSRK